MSDGMSELFDNVVRILIIFGFITVFSRFSIYLLVQNNSKLSLGKAMAEIEERIDKVGYIEQDYVHEMLDEYCYMSAITGYEVTEVNPSFDVKPAYLGHPLYVEVKLTYTVLGKSHEMFDRVTAYNRGYYGGSGLGSDPSNPRSGGYNTINEH